MYKVLVPIHRSGSEEEHILPMSLLIMLVVARTTLHGTSIAVIDKDHIAITGCLESPGSHVKGKVNRFQHSTVKLKSLSFN